MVKKNDYNHPKIAELLANEIVCLSSGFGKGMKANL
jgi:hypothetical protein